MEKKHLLVAAGLGLAQLVLHVTAGRAQDTAKVLRDVVITASKVEQKQSQTGKVVSIITREQLDRSSGKSVAELLGEQPGIIVNGAGSNPGLNKSLYLRGAGSQYTLVLIDGVLVNDPSVTGGSFDLRLLPVDQIDHIEILRGGQSTLYGSAAVAGVINIVTKKDAAPGFHISGAATGGSYGTFKQNIGTNSKIGVFGYNLSYTHEQTKGISEAAQPDNAATPFDRDGFNQDALNANFSVAATQRLQINPFIRYLYGNFKYDDGAFTDANDIYNTKHISTGTNAVYALNKGSVNFNYNYENTGRNYITAYGTSPYTGRLNYTELYFNQQVGRYVKILAGVDDRHSQINAGKTAALDSSANLFSAYASVYLNNLASFFNLEAGTRYNHHNKYGSNWTYSVTPSVNIIGNKLKAFGTVSTSFNAPDLNQLFGRYGANPNLLPEKSNSYEAGLSTALWSGAFNMRLVGYQRKIQDAIVYTTGYINQDKQNARGIEVEPSLNMGKLTLNGFYTLFDANTVTKDRQGNEVQTNGIIRRPKNIFGGFAGMQVDKALYINLNFRSYGKRTDSYYNSSNYTTSMVNLGSYRILDAYAEYGFLNKRLKVFADVKNILGSKYMEVYGYNTMGANFNAGISFTR